jgi:5-methyltetrahydropteroyltriglutamate--homocysteine methyltransferase
MVEFKTQEIGSLKKPTWLLEYLKSRASDDEKKEALNEAAFLNVKMLENIGLDFIYDGEVRRIEMYELPVKNIDGFEFAGRVRSWDNRYYKKARVIGEVKYRSNYHLEEFLYVKSIASKIPKVPVTGAYTIMDWSYNEYYKDRSELAFELSKVVRRVMSDLAEYGAPVLQIDEPAATTHPDEMDMFVDVFNEQVRGINAKISTHICYSGDEYSSLMPRAAEIKASHFALEFANRDKNELGVNDESRPGYRALKAFREYGNGKEIGLGVLDVHTDFIEPPELIRDRILYAVKILGDYSKIYINPDCGLRTRQRKIAFEKLKNMIKGVKMAESAIY